MEIMPMKDMALDAKEAQELYMPTPGDQPKYPYGLSISLCQDELEKLSIDFDDVSVGDMVHLHAMAIVTSKSENETQTDGPKCRVEFQITHLASESEDEENVESKSSKISKLYK